MKVVLEGPFEEAHLEAFASALRRIDDLRPHDVFTMRIEDPDGTVDDTAAVLERILPRLAGRQTTGPFKQRDLSDGERQAIVYGLMLAARSRPEAMTALRKVNGVDKRLWVEENRPVRMVPPDPPDAA